MTTGSEHPLYSLRVRQQPERARLCSYKEENETIPLDELLESTSFFIRATIVAAKAVNIPIPDHGLPSTLEPTYPAIKTPIGADATTGEVIQTPEKLRLLDGRISALCIFAKISVRVPGVFRLMFTLYETTESGVMELTRTVSEPFEVFSPKLFKGMHESTPLTRHLAAQGLKVKLRTDTTVGRQSVSRRRTSNTNPPATTTASASDRAHSASPSVVKAQHRTSSERASSARPSPLVTQPPFESHLSRPANSTRRTMGDSPRSLVWKQGAEDVPAGGPGPSTMGKRRFVDDGTIPSLYDLSSRYDFTRGPPATDLSAFSLSRMDHTLPGSGRVSPHNNRSGGDDPRNTNNSPHPHSHHQSYDRQSSSNPYPSSHHDNQHRSHSHSHTQTHHRHHQAHESSRSSMSSHQPFRSSFANSNDSSPSTHTSNSTAASSFSSVLPSPYPRLNIGPGDDGIPILPLPNMFPSYSRSADFVAPSVNQVLGGSAIQSPSPGGSSSSPGSGRVSASGLSPPVPSMTKRPSPLTLPPIRQGMEEEAEWAREVARQRQ
nr:uncharacterized protein CI109_006974 [Kwoniella shandongensis]KAA5524716.1 hypothetical protein CI109_006974 [Kwoniella shandongensis]